MGWLRQGIWRGLAVEAGGTATEDAIRVVYSDLLACGSGTCTAGVGRALDVAVEAADDVAVGGVFEVAGFGLVDGILKISLFAVSRRKSGGLFTLLNSRAAGQGAACSPRSLGCLASSSRSRAGP